MMQYSALWTLLASKTMFDMFTRTIQLLLAGTIYQLRLKSFTYGWYISIQLSLMKIAGSILRHCSKFGTAKPCKFSLIVVQNFISLPAFKIHWQFSTLLSECIELLLASHFPHLF
jgi:hypothetical protein